MKWGFLQTWKSLRTLKNSETDDEWSTSGTPNSPPHIIHPQLFKQSESDPIRLWSIMEQEQVRTKIDHQQSSDDQTDLEAATARQVVGQVLSQIQVESEILVRPLIAPASFRGHPELQIDCRKLLTLTLSDIQGPVYRPTRQVMTREAMTATIHRPMRRRCLFGTGKVDSEYEWRQRGFKDIQNKVPIPPQSVLLCRETEEKSNANSDIISVIGNGNEYETVERIPRTAVMKKGLAPLAAPESSISSSDSESIRQNLLHDKWRVLFDKFDPEGFGEIPWPDFMMALKSPHFIEAVGPGKILLLQTLGMSHGLSNAITFQHFVNIMSGKRSRSFECAVHHRDREISSESDFHLLPGGYKQTGVKRMARLIADEFLTDERDRKYYADHYRCLPPPLFIISVTLIELGFFTYYTVWHGEISSSGPLPMDSPFVYRPDKRQEVWRFLFYMVLHAGWVHLMFNLLVQLLVGLPLEMVHGSVRIGCVYMAGVLAGSLGTSVFDPDVYLVGASGGVYALLAAHLANVLLNYNNMEFGLVRLLGVFLIASVDVGFAIYDRYAPSPAQPGAVPPVSYVAHLTGALAGLTIGLLVLKNFEQRLREQLMWWFALGVYAACTLFAILFNVFHPGFPYNKY